MLTNKKMFANIKLSNKQSGDLLGDIKMISVLLYDKSLKWDFIQLGWNRGNKKLSSLNYFLKVVKGLFYAKIAS